MIDYRIISFRYHDGKKFRLLTGNGIPVLFTRLENVAWVACSLSSWALSGHIIKESRRYDLSTLTIELNLVRKDVSFRKKIPNPEIEARFA